MSLNDILLNPQLLTDLYSNVLVETHTTNMPTQPKTPDANPMPAERPVNFLGKNEKQVLIAVSKDEVPYLPDGELNFLANILSACQLSLADVAIVNWKNVAVPYEEVINRLASKTIILFDISPIEFGLPINFPNFQIQQFSNRRYLSAPSLTAIEQDTTTKRQLWTALKTIFSI